MNKEYLKKLGQSLYFDMDEIQLEALEIEFVQLLKKIEDFKKIDTADVVATNFCLVNSCSCLRKDEIKPETNSKKHLQNAKNVVNGFVVIK